MSNSILANIGLTALKTQFAGLQTTGHNIANASSPGYSRQQVDITSLGSQFINGGYYGRGVQVQAVQRAHDKFLSVQAANASSLANFDATRLQQLKSLETIFQTGETGLGDAVGQMFKAMTDVSSNPGDLSARRVVLERASDLAGLFSKSASDIEQLQVGISTAMQGEVVTINGLVDGIARVNQQIKSLASLDAPPNDLLDQRDYLIGQLAAKVKIDRIDEADGTTQITIAGGRQLVIGTRANHVAVTADINDSTRVALSLDNGFSFSVVPYEVLAGGSTYGYLKFQNEDLVAGRNLVGRLAAAVATAVNEQQQRGITLQPPLGTVYGSPLFAIGTPQAVAALTNAKDGTGAFVGTVSLSIENAADLQPSDYDLRPDGAGTFKLTRLSDGLVRTVADGETVDGFQINAAGLAPDDHFTLRPVGTAALRMQSLLSNPLDLAAASPLVATTDPGNTGTATVTSLVVTQVPLPFPGARTDITFTDDSGNYTWEVLDGGGATLATGTATWAPSLPIPPAGLDFNGFKLMIDGVPRSGDVLRVSPTSAAGIATNNGNALSLSKLVDAGIVGGNTATAGYAQAMADIGVRVQSATTSSTLSTAVAERAEEARASVSGVNLDEEAAKLIQFQQGYQASAKVLTVAQSIFDTLLNAVSR